MGEEVEITGWNPVTGTRIDSKASGNGQVIIKTYTGTQEEATRAFGADSSSMAARGYSPTSQTWAEGSWGIGSFIVALLLCFILIGFLVLVYLLIVKPDGTLSVTYELRSIPPSPRVGEEKMCPKCAERVKTAAVVCRFCGHEFSKA